MIYWAWFLHLYQPPTQFPEVTKKISKDCYEKLIRVFKDSQSARLTINMPASLVQQLVDLKLRKIISDFKFLAEDGKIEFTGTAAYHPLLPMIPKKEIVRQVKINETISRKYFGNHWRPNGFFPPEMAYSVKVGEAVESLGYKWILLDESALKPEERQRPAKRVYQKSNLNPIFFIRDLKLSLAIAFATVKNLKDLMRFFDREGYINDGDSYIITAMDGETFGHHQPRQLEFLRKIFSLENSQRNPFKIKFVTVSELVPLFSNNKRIVPRFSTWGRSWKRWKDPKNPIHKLQWQLYRLAIDSRRGNDFGQRVNLLDQALHSDQFWWASHSPYWHLGMVEKGAKMLKDAVLESKVSGSQKKEAVKIFNKIISMGKRLYGNEIITG